MAQSPPPPPPPHRPPPPPPPPLPPPPRRTGRPSGTAGWLLLVTAGLVAFIGLGVVVALQEAAPNAARAAVEADVGTSQPDRIATTQEVITPTREATTTSEPTTAVADPDAVVSVPDDADAITEILALLATAPETEPPGYDRSRFRHWIQQGDGCDTRERVLIDEAIGQPQIDIPCTIVAGDWYSPYDGVEIQDPAEIQIDHVVPLHEAWQSGAADWTDAAREAFANDLDHDGTLVAVSAQVNTSKSDRDPAEWRPPSRDAWCQYAIDWITVKVRWGLTADRAEWRSLRDLLEACVEPATSTTQVAPTTTRPPTSLPEQPPDTPPPTPAPTPPPTPPPTFAPTPPPTLAPPPPPPSDCHPSYPTLCLPGFPDLDCADIPAGNFPVLPPDPHGLDGNDNDGWGCESN